MKHIAYLRPDGVVQSTAAMHDDEQPPAITGLTTFELAEPLGGAPSRLVDGEIVPIEPPVPTLAEIKTQRWEALKPLRARAEYARFMWDGSTFDGDAQSQRRIQGAAQMAALALAASTPFEITWTLADNSTRTLSATDMVAVGQALAAGVQTAYETGRTLRAAIEAATTEMEVAAVVWPA